jgi:hypothetical protein
MIRSAASKVIWVGRTAATVFGLALVLALVLGVATMALAAVPGDPFRLGKLNAIDAVSRLKGSVGGPMLLLDNDSQEARATALKLQVEEGKAPLKVNALAGKARNLNADKLDGKSEADFYAAGSKVADSVHADQADTATTADNADLLDNKTSSDFQPAYERTVVVSPVGTDTENGQALLDALTSINDASATKEYLLYIEPGTYDLGTSTLRMRQHVDIEGAGELKTIITGSVSHCPTEVSVAGLLRGATDAELRFLTVRNTAQGQCNIAIYNFNSCPRLTHVTAEATGGAGNFTTGVVNFSTCSSMTMTDVTATASGGADNRGVLNVGAQPTIKQSKVSGSTYSLYQESGGTVKVALSQLVGPINVVSGTLQCFNNYDQNMAAVTC